MSNGYTAEHPVGIVVEAQMLESVAGYRESDMQRELSFAVACLDFDDPASMRWLASLLARRINEVEGR